MENSFLSKKQLWVTDKIVQLILEDIEILTKVESQNRSYLKFSSKDGLIITTDMKNYISNAVKQKDYRVGPLQWKNDELVIEKI